MLYTTNTAAVTALPVYFVLLRACWNKLSNVAQHEQHLIVTREREREDENAMLWSGAGQVSNSPQLEYPPKQLNIYIYMWAQLNTFSELQSYIEKEKTETLYLETAVKIVVYSMKHDAAWWKNSVQQSHELILVIFRSLNHFPLAAAGSLLWNKSSQMYTIFVPVV